MRYSSIESNVNCLYHELKDDEEIKNIFKVLYINNLTYDFTVTYELFTICII